MAAVPEFGDRVSSPSGAETTHDLFARFRGPIYRYCLHQLGSPEEAEDAVQTTFMNAFRGLQRGIVPRVEAAWLFKIAQNVCLSRRRSARRRGRIEIPTDFELLQEVVPAREVTGDELMRLQDVLQQMPSMQRRAILMREWRGLSYREIAAELQLSLAAVEALVFRARRALAAGLADGVRDGGRRKRARYGVDASGVVATLKAIFGGGTAAKVAVTAVAVATTAIASADVSHRRHPVVPVPSPPVADVVVSDVLGAAPSRPVVRRPVRRPDVARAAPRAAVSTRLSSVPPAPAVPSAPPRVFRHESDMPAAPATTMSTVEHQPAAPSVAAAVVTAPAAPPSAPKPAADEPAPHGAPASEKPSAGHGHGNDGQHAAPPVTAPAETSPNVPDDPEPQASDGHGPATAPGRQDKPAEPGKSKKNGG